MDGSPSSAVDAFFVYSVLIPAFFFYFRVVFVVRDNMAHTNVGRYGEMEAYSPTTKGRMLFWLPCTTLVCVFFL